ncbi:NAD-P-binding protein [Trametes coccinea BRFM310]|uniref:NAD-P-binding protein n=1 Tax=Trametes coccinea (strain BRFM310) TaxID=1353009 RepID=A0A1Y2J246_TRAC3|nr:NAD-P-binding protein [Trametes coccinea BRFM310]
MSAAKTTIFLTGATGYIGATVLQRLLQHPNAARFELTALVRSPEKARILAEEYGVRAVVGSNAELEKLTQLAEGADIVLNIADSDDIKAAGAIMQGLKARYHKTGTKPTLIHTSGTGFLTDDARGMYASDKVYHDSIPEEIEALPDTAFHRNVDLAVIAGDREGYLRALILSPSLIFGQGAGPLFQRGLANPRSIQLPLLIKASLARGRGAGMVGAGKSVWNHVHVDDVADSYITLVDALLRDAEAVPHGRAGFYIIENGEHTWYDLSAALAAALVELGLATAANSEPVPFTQEDIDRFIGNTFLAHLALGSNARGRGEQARSLGWKPKYTTADLFAS